MATTSVGGRVLPVGKIVAVGRNYADHAREMGAEPPEEPILFLKPSTALLSEPTELALPTFSREIHHEVEMVLRVGRSGVRWSAAEAELAIDGVAVGLDLTARDLQAAAKQKGQPWAVAKGFDGSAPLGNWSPVSDVRDLGNLSLGLRVDGTWRQRGNTRDMIHDVVTLLRYISARFTLEAGDLVFTGTPSGVGPLLPGQRIRAELGARSALECRVGSPSADSQAKGVPHG